MTFLTHSHPTPSSSSIQISILINHFTHKHQNLFNLRFPNPFVTNLTLHNTNNKITNKNENLCILLIFLFTSKNDLTPQIFFSPSRKTNE